VSCSPNLLGTTSLVMVFLVPEDGLNLAYPPDSPDSPDSPASPELAELAGVEDS
jgi:hypothetical protein